MSTNFAIESNRLRFIGELPKTPEQALALSIEKWEVLATALQGRETVLLDGAYQTCGLCRYHTVTVNPNEESDDEEWDECGDCPVNLSGHRGCKGTPYEEYYQAWIHDHVPNALEAAKQEVIFLQSLKGDA